MNEVKKQQRRMARLEGKARAHRALAARVADLEARETAVAAQQRQLAALTARLARLEARLDGPKLAADERRPDHSPGGRS